MTLNLLSSCNFPQTLIFSLLGFSLSWEQNDKHLPNSFPLHIQRRILSQCGPCSCCSCGLLLSHQLLFVLCALISEVQSSWRGLIPVILSCFPSGGRCPQKLGISISHKVALFPCYQLSFLLCFSPSCQDDVGDMWGNLTILSFMGADLEAGPH